MMAMEKYYAWTRDILQFISFYWFRQDLLDYQDSNSQATPRHAQENPSQQDLLETFEFCHFEECQRREILMIQVR